MQVWFRFAQKNPFFVKKWHNFRNLYNLWVFCLVAGEFSTLTVNFVLQRHMGYFLIQMYVPCTLIVSLSWVSFWINREATADRVGLGVTTVLTLATLSMDSRTDLPKVPYPTALDWFVILCFSEFLSFLNYISLFLKYYCL